jgi:hypothetical protein
MAGFRFNFFKGIRPRLLARLLPEGEAVIARDVRLGDGALDVWGAPTLEKPICADNPYAEHYTMHRMRNAPASADPNSPFIDPVWLEWHNDVDVARGPIENDRLERTYYTGDGLPKMTHLGLVTMGLTDVVEVLTSDQTWTVPAGVTEVTVLVVGGGGGGGSSGTGGGGGGGDVRIETIPVTPGADITVVVGSGGSGNSDPVGNGGTSSFGAIAAIGGGGGAAAHLTFTGRDGASGGGGSSGNGSGNHPGGAALGVNGHAGGSSGPTTSASLYSSGGGGGGAGAPGGNGTADSSTLGNQVGGAGGDGMYVGEVFGEIVGMDGWVAAGGQGGRGNGSYGSVGQGNRLEGPMANTGSGGRGFHAGTSTVGNGAAGVVAVRYAPAVTELPSSVPCLPSRWRFLGIPAPSSAPEVSGQALPDATPTGEITGFVSNTVKADVAVPFNTGNYPHSTGTAEHFFLHTIGLGQGSNPGQSLVPEDQSRVYEFNIPIGTRLRVTAIVDENTVELEDANAGAFIARSTVQTASTQGPNNWRSSNLDTTEPISTRFYLPNGIRATLTAHELQEGDVIRVASVTSPVTVTFLGSATGGPPNTGLNRSVYGAEAGQTNAPAPVRTWPNRTFFDTDSFYITGLGWAFVDFWVDGDGPGSANTHIFSGNVAYELAERGGEAYRDILSNIENRTYVYTYVSDLGEEGPPSDPSNVIIIPREGFVDISGFSAPPTQNRVITHLRIYRANTGLEVTEFQFVDEVAFLDLDYGVSFRDEVRTVDLGEVLQTASWEPPPEDLRGLIALPNGALAGFTPDKTIHMSEPGFPHAWPPEYSLPVDFDLIALAPLPNGFAALTTGTPYMVVGDHPRAMSKSQFEWQSCVSKRSIAITLDGIMYASPDGLVSMGSGGFQVITAPFFTKREWQAFLSPATLQGEWHDNKYFGFHSAGAFVFDPTDDSVHLTTLSMNNVRATFVDTEADTLYVADEDNILIWDGDQEAVFGSPLWKSPPMVCPYPLNLASARVLADAYDVDEYSATVVMKLFDDRGELVVEKTVLSKDEFYLPDGYLTDWVQIQIEFGTKVQMVHLAETVEELWQG